VIIPVNRVQLGSQAIIEPRRCGWLGKGKSARRRGQPESFELLLSLLLGDKVYRASGGRRLFRLDNAPSRAYPRRWCNISVAHAQIILKKRLVAAKGQPRAWRMGY
jgi:hypothetical protein